MYIKTSFASLMVLSSYSFAQQPIPMCAHIYAVSESVMMRRQHSPSSESMKSSMSYADNVLELKSPDAASLYRQMVIDAYRMPRAKTIPERTDVAKEFGAKWGAKCWETKLSKAQL